MLCPKMKKTITYDDGKYVTHTEEFLECIKRECGWWCETGGDCAILRIAFVLSAGSVNVDARVAQC